MIKKVLLILWSIFCILILSSCQEVEIERAIAVVTATEGNQVSGIVTFQQKEGHVLVNAKLNGLNPNQKHGFHVHEYGDISAKDGKSAGGHYNPDGHPHGLPPTKMRHAGSFGNIQADENGQAIFTLEDDTISVSGHQNPIIGRAVVVHAKEDIGAQPTGAAGPRIGTGVIGIAK